MPDALAGSGPGRTEDGAAPIADITAHYRQLYRGVPAVRGGDGHLHITLDARARSVRSPTGRSPSPMPCNRDHLTNMAQTSRTHWTPDARSRSGPPTPPSAFCSTWLVSPIIARS